MILEEFEGFGGCHVEYVGNRFALEFDLEGLGIVAFSFTLLALDIDVGQEVHLYFDESVAAAGLAASAFDIEREPAGIVAADLCLFCLGEDGSYVVEDLCVGRRV